MCNICDHPQKNNLLYGLLPKMKGSSCHHIDQAESARIRNLLIFLNATTLRPSSPKTSQPEQTHFTPSSSEVKDFRNYGHVSNIKSTRRPITYVDDGDDSYFDIYEKVRVFVVITAFILAYFFVVGVFIYPKRKSERTTTGPTKKEQKRKKSNENAVTFRPICKTSKPAPNSLMIGFVDSRLLSWNNFYR